MKQIKCFTFICVILTGCASNNPINLLHDPVFSDEINNRITATLFVQCTIIPDGSVVDTKVIDGRHIWIQNRRRDLNSENAMLTAIKEWNRKNPAQWRPVKTSPIYEPLREIDVYSEIFVPVELAFKDLKFSSREDTTVVTMSYKIKPKSLSY